MRWRNVLLVALAISGFGLMVAATWLTGHRAASASGTSIVTVSAGGYHTCALTSAGGVECWGGNNYGQLGDGTNTNRLTPVSVSGLATSVGAVSSGDRHTCVLTTAGGVKCWGDNYYGQLGNGTTIASSTPVDVAGLTSGVISISSGYVFTCALTTAGGVKCWGENRWGELGNGTTTTSSTPVDVSGLQSGVTAISPGAYHFCALMTSGGAKCWGENSLGQLGIGSSSGPEVCPVNSRPCSTVPVDVSNLNSGVDALTAGNGVTCAVTTLGGAKCWGLNSVGQLGNGTNTGPQMCNSNPCSTTPVSVYGLGSGTVALTTSGGHTCALTTPGGVLCWGANSNGQLGEGTTNNSSFPLEVAGLQPKPTPTPCPDSDGDGLTDCEEAALGTNPGDIDTDDDGLLDGLEARTYLTDPLAPDTDDDGLADGAEVLLFHTDPLTPDTDGDGCGDGKETGLDEHAGGRRDPLNSSDYFNPTHDGENRIDDILAVVNQYYDDAYLDPPTNSMPNPNYNPDTDRTYAGPNAWNLGPGNGLQRIDDILNAVKQYYHDCA